MLMCFTTLNILSFQKYPYISWDVELGSETFQPPALAVQLPLTFQRGGLLYAPLPLNLDSFWGPWLFVDSLT